MRHSSKIFPISSILLTLALHMFAISATPVRAESIARVQDDPQVYRDSYFKANKLAPGARVEQWEQLVRALRTAPRAAQLERINAFFNDKIRFMSDMEAWGVPEYWAAPMETLAKGAGDCDDIAIAKYFTLLRVGVDPENLRLYYAFASKGVDEPPQPHLVLGYLPAEGAMPLILDNLTARIEPLDKRANLQVIASFANDAVYRMTWGTTFKLPVHRAQRWVDALKRASAEGFTIPVRLPAPQR